jgi:hypothetical protein
VAIAATGRTEFRTEMLLMFIGQEINARFPPDGASQFFFGPQMMRMGMTLGSSTICTTNATRINTWQQRAGDARRQATVQDRSARDSSRP